MSNEKIIDNNDEMRLDGMSEVNIDKMVDASALQRNRMPALQTHKLSVKARRQ